jgi:hypothetical protein
MSSTPPAEMCHILSARSNNCGHFIFFCPPSPDFLQAIQDRLHMKTMALALYRRGHTEDVSFLRFYRLAEALNVDA